MAIGVSLTGGGARGSYQAGVLRAIGELVREQGLEGAANPLQYWSGVSAGSINASACVAGIDRLSDTSLRLTDLWCGLEPESVYRTDLGSLGRNGLRWVRDLTFGSLLSERWARSLLDTAPLSDLVSSHLDFSTIQRRIDAGLVKALGVSAYSYRDNRTVTWVQSREPMIWDKERRYAKPSAVRPEHLLASCAIPILFPAISIEGEFLGDGGFRNISPISPVIHMGARRIIVIGVRGPNEVTEHLKVTEPTVAKIAGTILNALFFDTTELDIERVRTVNEMVRAMRKDIVTQRSDYTVLDCLVIKPSRDITQMARDRAKTFPRLIRFLVGGLGPVEDAAELASYILFTPIFTKDLAELGYEDGRRKRQELLRFFESARDVSK